MYHWEELLNRKGKDPALHVESIPTKDYGRIAGRGIATASIIKKQL